eukprot:7588960-Lingulodinium_polyedra.AAC.1
MAARSPSWPVNAAPHILRLLAGGASGSTILRSGVPLPVTRKAALGAAAVGPTMRGRSWLGLT